MTNTRFSLRMTSALIATACAALFATQSFAQTPSQKKSEGKLTVVDSEDLDGAVAGGAHSVEVRIVDGDVTVKRDGKEVPKDRIKKEGGRIIILDENGNELKDFAFGEGGEFRMFGGGAHPWRGMTMTAGETPTVMLGVHMGEPSPDLEYHLGLEHGTSTIISGLYEGLPAHEAGLNQHDVIIKVDGREPADAASIKKALANKQADDTVTFTVIQKGKARDVKVKLAAFDAEKMQSSKWIGQTQTSWMGQLLGNGEFDNVWIPKMEGLNQELFIAPGADGRKQMELIAPRIHEKLRQQFNEASKQGEGVENQLNRLDERMADLEQLLQKLIEKQERGTR
jgi:hypothetical protein